ncbi:DUF2953 domain-containing protein [Paenibacillus caui]|uniref:DUF2953 domain-containing protein n=1 Tax=Paenibacillus caui TaxID=2873927 RepID=UPI001CA87093|nr:DUF2953 domain-containing protein [Paenibacillus caui]
MFIWISVGIILLIFLLLLLIVLLSRVTINVHASKQNEDEEITADVKLLFGMIKLHYEVPKIVFDNFKQGFKVLTEKKGELVNKNGTNHEEQEYIGRERIGKWIDIYKQILKSTADLKRWLSSTLKHLKITTMDWSTEFAFKEADYTAVACGLLWALKSYIIGSLSFQVKMENTPQLLVNPRFGTPPHFATNMNCIAQISLGYAMYAGLTLIVRVLKVKGGTKQWLNILFKA